MVRITHQPFLFAFAGVVTGKPILLKLSVKTLHPRSLPIISLSFENIKSSSMKIGLTIVLFIICLASHAQRKFFEPSKIKRTDMTFTDSMSEPINMTRGRLLMLGFGSSMERVFLEDLGGLLKNSLGMKDVTVTYTYLGKNAVEAKATFKQLDKAGYVAILLVNPKDTATLERKSFLGPAILDSYNPFVSARSEGLRLQYGQQFDLLLFKTAGDMKRVWNASVEITTLAGKTDGVHKLSDKIVESFKRHKYVE
jgi:hypothetical protein